ncbi:LacI family DNA-binding transcriptional regulator [Actinomadura hibisca]|uniref:LacI family DNA-binding transcriptional regulator n=1 Tax=Actinomadura hibisca TaxID=68565 RepID=UPI00082BA4D8|nr:LacI family DNA-binding transcriptional regulator [Actinomadura hibisca]
MTDPPSGPRPATSTDVARLAGVSQATVSYVMNDAPGVKISDSTRERVRQAAEQLGYSPHASARTLRKGRSDVVLMPVPDIPVGHLAGRFFRELGRLLRGHGHTLVMYGDTDGRGATAAREWAQWRPAAVLVAADRLTRAGVRQLHAAGVATVVAMGPRPSLLAPTLVFDDYAIGGCAVEHLIARGRRRLGVVVPAEPELAVFAGPRFEGAERAAAARGVAVRRIVLPSDEAGAAEVVAGWDAGERPDGIFAYNDDYAMVLMRVMQDAGLAVPGDVAVVGADDLPLGRLLRPRLTSVRVAGDRSAAQVADRLHQMIVAAEREAGVVLFESSAEIVHRESS